MTAPRQRSLRRRIAIRLGRYALWPIAQLRPGSGWARIYDRLCQLEGRNVDSRAAARRRRVSPALTSFIVLVFAALLAWIADVLRRPPPVPPALRGAECAQPAPLPRRPAADH